MPSTARGLAAARVWWLQHARANQQAPPDWALLWVILSGRGFGKTRMGAEEVVWHAQTAAGSRWACVAPTSDDARETMAFGPSGLRAVLDRYSLALGFQCYEHQKAQTAFALWNGSRIRYIGAEKPDRLRGPNWHGGWGDEVAAWRYPETWDQLELSVRAPHPDLPAARILATTTPKPTPLVRRLARQASVTTTGSTFDNIANLDPAFVAKLEGLYGGTRFGRQELHGEILANIEGAMFRPEWLHPGTPPGPVLEVVVGVDPAVTSGPDADETGIVAVAKHAEGYQVLSDRSGRYTPDEWARVVAHEADRWGADRVVAEVNNGGDLVLAVLRAAGVPTRVKKVHASRGKAIRAEPIAALYEQGLVWHTEGLTTLEQQMVEWVPGVSGSPDRLDALVWALTSLSGRVLRPVGSFAT
jgi:phage terminase large subunit-like protein